MICKWCNKEVQNNTNFCQNCGGNLVDIQKQESTIQQPVTNNAQYNLGSGTIQPSYQQSMSVVTQQESKANIGLVILSFLIPLAGLIIFLVKKDNDKKTAKSSGIAALISVGICILISIISIPIILSSFNNSSYLDDKIKDNVNNNITENNNNINNDINNNEPILPENDSNENIVINNEWKNYEFVVNNKKLTLPCTYDELSSIMSAKMKSSYEKSYIESGYYSLINLYKDDKLALYIEMLNDTDQDILYTDAKITRVSQTKYQVSVGANEIIFPGGLKVGQEMTKDNLVNLLGEPSDTKNYTSDNYISDEYSYFENSTYTTINYYKIKIVNGVIDELTLDNRNYK